MEVTTLAGKVVTSGVISDGVLNLTKPVPILVVYATAVVQENGDISIATCTGTM